MRSLTIAVLLATAVALTRATSPLDLVDDLIASPSSAEVASLPAPPVKLDKNLRRALLKALVDLEAESVEQQQQEENPTNRSNEEENAKGIDENKYDFLEISKQKSTSFSFDGFPSEEDTPSEDKLQNTTFVESDKYVTGDEATTNNRQPSHEQQPPKDYTKGVQVHHVVSSEKSSAIYETKQPGELLETVESRNIASSTLSSSAEPTPTASSSSNNNNDAPLIQQSVTFAPIVQTSRETLTGSASRNIASAAANSLVAPRPTAATNPVNETSTNFGSKIVQLSGKSSGSANKEEAEDVRIFQAPLVAAFTVQQDERGVPKNIVPLYKSSNNQPLSLQEQLEFKQQLLEKQLAQLQAQQAQQTQFLLRQRQAYEAQVRQKQQQEYYLQEQRRLKLLQEQEQQRLRLQQQQQQQQQQQRPAFQQPANIVQQQLPLAQQQTIFKANNVPQRQQQQPIFKPNNVPQQQQQTLFKPNNAFSNVQQSTGFNQQQTAFKTNNVQLQPSLSLEVPSNVPAIPFKSAAQQQPLRAPLPSNFQPFPVDFQQPPAPAPPVTRFNRQEAFNAVGNFGFNHFQNDDKSIRQSQFVQQQRAQQSNNNFAFNSGFRQQQRPFASSVTPARQIQELLYQSGIAGDLQGSGTRNQEDINIVSKVLALNVGAFPEQRTKGFQQFTGLKK